jgi:hypothetical protein
LKKKRRHKDRLEGHPTGPNRERLEEDPEEDLEDLGIEEELLNSILEKLSIDVKKCPNRSSRRSVKRDDGQRKEKILLLLKELSEELEEEQEDEEKEDLKEAIDKLQKEKKIVIEKNKKYKNMLVQLKDKLEEVNLSNAKLLYTNRIGLSSASLNERQKNKIVEVYLKSDSVEEAKVIYETLQSAVGSTRKRAPKSLSEVVQRSSTTLPRREKRGQRI